MVFFHADFDGYLSHLKGCGVSYPEMEKDANILDGGRQNRWDRVSNLGQLLADSHENLCPRFSTDPAGHQTMRKRVYQVMTDFVSKKSSPDEIGKLFLETESACLLANSNAKDLIDSTVLLPGGIAYSDLMPYIKSGEPLSLPLWKGEVIGRFNPSLIASLGLGHMGEQVFCELPRSAQRGTDLRDYLPRGVVGRVPFRVQIPIKLWPEFLANWRRDHA